MGLWLLKAVVWISIIAFCVGVWLFVFFVVFSAAAAFFAA